MYGEMTILKKLIYLIVYLSATDVMQFNFDKNFKTTLIKNDNLFLLIDIHDDIVMKQIKYAVEIIFFKRKKVNIDFLLKVLLYLFLVNIVLMKLCFGMIQKSNYSMLDIMWFIYNRNLLYK